MVRGARLDLSSMDGVKPLLKSGLPHDSFSCMARKPVDLVRTPSPPEMASTKNKEHLSPPPLPVSDRKSIKKIIIKYGGKKKEIKVTGAALESQKEELYRQHESISCSSQVASVAPAESPRTILELMTSAPLPGRPIPSPLTSGISNMVTTRSFQKVATDLALPIKDKIVQAPIKCTSNKDKRADHGRNDIARRSVIKMILDGTKERQKNNTECSESESMRLQGPADEEKAKSVKEKNFSERIPGMNNCQKRKDEFIAVVSKHYLAPLSSQAGKLQTNKDPLTKQGRKLEQLGCINEISHSMKKTSSKRVSELEILDSGRLHKRRKLEDRSLKEKDMNPDGHRTLQKGTISSMSIRSSGSHQIQTSTGSSCILDGQEKGKIKSISSKNEYDRSYLLLNEARDFKHRADRLMREGGEALGTTLYLESVLKFLTVASLWELSGEMNQSAMQLYSDTAKFSMYVAVQSENQKNNTAATLAYKAAEIAHLRYAFLLSPALAGKEAVCLGFEATSAFEATRRYMLIMEGKELTSPVKACLNLSYFSLAKFLDQARQAI